MLIILTTTNRNGLLPTVLSRAQVIQFPAPRRRDVEAQLVKAGVAASRAGVVARMTVSVDDGVALANDEDVAKRIHVMLQLVARLAAHDELAFPFIQTDVVKACPDRDSQRQFVRLLALATRKPLIVVTVQRRRCSNKMPVLPSLLHCRGPQSPLACKSY
ncbi:hypothetical protein [Lacticaseibacillus thailandensis]|uniref:hypothetical protein n=1 Tax=Lacticaseibacillus thailandensis TaxID=381741 RepID=UPI0006D2A68F|nr:hypothetical protein [Lacticaseibacillus thailandensis]